MDSEVELLRGLVSSLPDPVFVLSESGRYVLISGGQDSSYYHDARHLTGLTLYDVLAEEQADWFLKQIRFTLDVNQMHVVEYRLAGTDVDGIDYEYGPEGDIHFEGHIQPMRQSFDGERAVVWLARNVNRRRERENELRHMSETDALTGAFNRRKLIEQLEYRFAEFRRYDYVCALMLFDIDRFKSVNDRFGHGQGDQVLCRVASVCSAALRDSDMLFRVGGEEFAVLAPCTDLAAARQAADRLRNTVAEETATLLPDDQGITISAGISAFQPGDADAQAVIRRADVALYEAKDGGRNQVVVEWD